MKVLITRKIPDVAKKLLLNNGFEVIVNKFDRAMSGDELIKSAVNADGIISLLTDKFDKTLIDKLSSCKIIANYAVGYNNIDFKYAKKKKIIVTNTPDVLTDSTADLTMTLVLACARRVIEGHSMIINKKFKGWKPELLLGMELKNKVFGIIGAGRIGSAVAERAKAFGCKIVYFSDVPNKYLERKVSAKRKSLNTLLSLSDIVSIHVPLNEKTFHLIDKKKLELIKPGAILINTARGEIVDEKSLISQLKNNRLMSAGFDVYENEPKMNPGLLKLKNVFLLPHIGSATVEARNAMAKLAAKNIIAVLSGKKPLTPVN